MSWLNFNESLNSIKGQLSSFASGVLADGIVEETENDVTPTKTKIEDLDERRKTHSPELQTVPQPNNPENANSWSWEPPGPPGDPPSSFATDLQKKIEILENEKKELVVSLEQLDLDCQQTTDKLVTLKDNLQTSYNELKTDFEKLQKEYGEVLTENMDKHKEIESLRAEASKKPVEERIRNLQEENQLLNTRLVASEKENETHNSELVQKFEELRKNYENTRIYSEEEKVKNKELHDLYNKLKDENAKLRIKLEDYKETNELKDTNLRLQTINDEFSKELQNLKRENEELKKIQNGAEIMKSEDKKLRDENEKLMIALEILQSDVEKLKNDKEMCEKLKHENEELKKIQNTLIMKSEDKKLLDENKKLKITLEKFQNDVEKLKNDKEMREKIKNEDLEEIKIKNEKLLEANENLKIIIEKFKIELEELQSANEQLREQTNIENEDQEALKIFNEELKIKLEKSQNHNEEIKKKHEELDSKKSKLLTEHEDLKILTEGLKNDLQRLQLANEELNQQLKNKTEDQSLATQFAKEKEAFHEKYLSIITENMRKYIDLDADDKGTTISSSLTDEPQILEFAGKVETLLKLLLDFKSKTETLEKELCAVTQEKNKIIAEKNFEIEKLLKNSEILSQEVITKTQAIKDYEDECGELMKNNDLLISELQNYKNSSGLQTISESNEDNLLLLETQLENANKKIQDMELIISDLENSKQDTNLETQTELEYIKKQLNMTGQELNHSKEEYQDLMLCHKHLEEEKRNLKSVLDKIKIEYENAEYKYTEVNVTMETLKEENEEYKNKALDLGNSHKKLEGVNFNLESKIELLQNVVDNLKQKLEVEMENTAQKELQVRNLIEKLQNAKMCETGLKLQVDTIYKELQTVSELKQTLERKLSESQNKFQELQEELIKSKEVKLEEDLNETNEVAVLLPNNPELQESNQDSSLTSKLQKQLENAHQEKQTIESDHSKLQNNLSQMSQQNHNLLQKVLFLETQLTEISTSRNELVALITAKHQENVHYHGEIQRLNHFLAAETEKAHLLEIQLHNLKTEPEPSLHDHEELKRKNEELTQKVQEIEKLTDQNNFLREKCEVLAQNLLQEQSNVQKVLSERISASEKEQSLAKESERLRAHLVEIEEMYTHELLQAEQKNKEMQTKVNEIEQREKDSSSIYTSVSIRANQQVETLQAQLQLVTNQRDELRMKVSDLEDEHNKQVAALTNLQLVLEQFQKERDKDVYQETERVRRQVTVERQVQHELRGEISNLRLQLDESKQGLQAASRLTDQLEKCKLQIVNYKDEVTKLQEQVKNREVKYKELSTQTDSKVDKTLIKNLVIGYITSHSSDQNQILKIIATVLDFNRIESDKVNLNNPQHGGWLSSILHPQSLNSSQDMTQQSLSEAFVRFLEKESKPKVLPNLLITNQAKKVEGSGSSSSTTPRQSPSPRVLSEVVLPTFVDFGKSRNSSSILKDVLKDNS